MIGPQRSKGVPMSSLNAAARKAWRLQVGMTTHTDCPARPIEVPILVIDEWEDRHTEVVNFLLERHQPFICVRPVVKPRPRKRTLPRPELR